MVTKLEQQYGDRALNGDLGQIEILEKKVSNLKRQLEEQEANESEEDTKKSERGSEEDTDDDEEEDYVEDLQEVIAKKKNKGPRVSVSAEAYGMWNKKEDFKARVIPKSADS